MSFVYFIQAGTDGPIKIGVAVDPVGRLAELQNANAAKLVLLAACPGRRDEESRLHAACRHSRIRGEWYLPTPRVLGVVRNPEAVLAVTDQAPSTIAICAEEFDSSRVELWDAIRTAYSRGRSLRAIAAAANMSHEQVRRIVKEP